MSDVPCETSCAIWVSAYRILCSVDALIEQIQDHTIFNDCKNECDDVRQHIDNALAEIEKMTNTNMTLKAALAPLTQRSTGIVQRINPKVWVPESEPSSLFEHPMPDDDPEPPKPDPVESVMELL